MHLIDEYRLSPVDSFRGGYLWIFISVFVFVVLSVFYPPGPGVTSWTELYRRLVCGLPCIAFFIAPSVGPVRSWLKKKWSATTSPLVFSVAASVLMALYFFMTSAWPSLTDFVLAFLALYLPFPLLKYLNEKNRYVAGWGGQILYILLLVFPPVSMLLISPMGSDLRLDFNLWFLLCLSGAILLFEHQLKMDVRYTFKMRGSDGLWVLAGIGALYLTVILPAKWMGFSDVVLHRRPLVGIIGAFFSKTWFVALSQEYVFRAVAVNSLPETGEWWTGAKGTFSVLAITSIWFGLTHYFIGGMQYVVLATIAGVIYGCLYLKTGRLSTAILAHGALDTIKYLFG